MPELKTTLVKESEIEVFDEESGQFVLNIPSKFYIQLATGDLLFFNTRDRQKCVDYVKEHYAGRYTIRTAKQGAGTSDVTCKGTQTRRGQKKY